MSSNARCVITLDEKTLLASSNAAAGHGATIARLTPVSNLSRSALFNEPTAGKGRDEIVNVAFGDVIPFCFKLAQYPW